MHIQVRRLLVFTPSGALLSNCDDHLRPAARVDPALLARFLSTMLQLFPGAATGAFEAPGDEQASCSQQSTTLNNKKSPPRSERTQTFGSSTRFREAGAGGGGGGLYEDIPIYDLEVLQQQCTVIRADGVFFAIFYSELETPLISPLRKRSRNTKYLATLICLYVMRHFSEFFSSRVLRRLAASDADPRSGLFSTVLAAPQGPSSHAPPARNHANNLWEGVLSSKDTLSDLESSTSHVHVRKKPSSLFPKSGGLVGFQSPGLGLGLGLAQLPSASNPNLRDFNLFFVGWGAE